MDTMDHYDVLWFRYLIGNEMKTKNLLGPRHPVDYRFLMRCDDLKFYFLSVPCMFVLDCNLFQSRRE